MNEADALDLMRFAIWTVIIVSAPCVLAAMLVGIGISVLQALTQIQEVTLTFVPKIMAIFLVSLLSATYMGASIYGLASFTFSRIESGF
ncbi:MAG: flagellar biosynthetic protein FliQ [Thermomicrobiales bacterium]